MAHLLRNGWKCRLRDVLRTRSRKPKIIGKSSTREKLIKALAISESEVNMRRRTEILNALEKMVDDLYEVGSDDAQYFEEMVGEAMDIILEYDQ